MDSKLSRSLSSLEKAEKQSVPFEVQVVASAESLVVEPAEVTYPEGGKDAWLVVLGAFFANFASLGYIISWGTFQAYYTQTVLSHESESTIAWIGSLQFSLIFLPGLFMGRLLDSGLFRIPLAIISAVFVVSVFATAQCKTYAELLVVQGLISGFCGGCLFSSSLSTLAQWFNKKRSMAYGVLSMGSSVGGVVYPIVIRQLLRRGVSFEWTVRTVGFIILGSLIISNLTIRVRLPPSKKTQSVSSVEAFKNPAYMTYILAALLALMGLYTPLTYFSVNGLFRGVSEDMSFYLVPIANGASLFGRIGAGLAADKVGPMNVLIPMTLGAAALSYAWPFASTLAGLIVIAVLNGACSGVFVALLPAPIARMGKIHDLGARLGMAMTLAAAGALAGPPISGAIQRRSGGFKDVGYYAGTMITASVLLLCVSRTFALRGRLVGKV